MKRLTLSLAASVSAILAAVFIAPGAHAAADPSATFLGLPAWIWMLANLVLYFGLLAYFVGPPITRFLDARTRRIEEDLAEAKERRAEASELQAGLGTQVAALEEQIEELRARAETEGQKEHDSIREQAVREKERMLAQAQTEIDHRMAQARQELKDYTAALAAQLAREQLQRELGPAEKKAIFGRNLTRLERGTEARQDRGAS
jgi:F-type H+-transporting ATPase subunit b